MLGLDIIDEYSRLGEEEMRRILRRIHKNSQATVVHQETCPCCGAKLVNLYRRETEWKCRRCWEKHDNEHGPTIKLGHGTLVAVREDGTHMILGKVKEEDHHG